MTEVLQNNMFQTNHVPNAPVRWRTVGLNSVQCSHTLTGCRVLSGKFLCTKWGTLWFWLHYYVSCTILAHHLVWKGVNLDAVIVFHLHKRIGMNLFACQHALLWGTNKWVKLVIARAFYRVQGLAQRRNTDGICPPRMAFEPATFWSKARKPNLLSQTPPRAARCRPSKSNWHHSKTSLNVIKTQEAAKSASAGISCRHRAPFCIPTDTRDADN